MTRATHPAIKHASLASLLTTFSPHSNVRFTTLRLYLLFEPLHLIHELEKVLVMGLFGGSKSSGAASEDPETRQLEKMIATEAKNDQKNLDHALKDLSKLDKTHEKAIKARILLLLHPARLVFRSCDPCSDGTVGGR